MEMDTWYDVRLHELAALTDRVNALLDEVQEPGGAPPRAPRIRELFDLRDRLAELRKKVRGER